MLKIIGYVLAVGILVLYTVIRSFYNKIENRLFYAIVVVILLCIELTGLLICILNTIEIPQFALIYLIIITILDAFKRVNKKKRGHKNGSVL